MNQTLKIYLLASRVSLKSARLITTLNTKFQRTRQKSDKSNDLKKAEFDMKPERIKH